MAGNLSHSHTGASELEGQKFGKDDVLAFGNIPVLWIGNKANCGMGKIDANVKGKGKGHVNT